MMALSFTKIVMLSLCLAALAAPPASAEYMISYQYDGVYKGKASLAPISSGHTCRALPLYSLEIKNGILRAWNAGTQTVKGFVTHDGFFNADYYFPGERGIRFEGMIGDDQLTGGVIDGECAWVIELSLEN